MTTGIKPWTNVGGGAQCANYGTTSVHHRLRGKPVVRYAGPASLPRSSRTRPPPRHAAVRRNDGTLESCVLNGKLAGKTASPSSPEDEYVRLRCTSRPITIPNHRGRTNIAEFHLTLVGSQPAVAFFLYRDRILADLDTGLWNGTSLPVQRQEHRRVRDPARRARAGRVERGCVPRPLGGQRDWRDAVLL